MLRPLLIGIPIIFVIAIAFVVGMNTIPFNTPAFYWLIGGYAVLFPLALIWMIVAMIRKAKRVIAGGDANLVQTGRRATAEVLSVTGGMTTIRLSGGPKMRLLTVRLRVDDPSSTAYETSVNRAVAYWQAPPQPGQRLTVYIDLRDRDNLFVDWKDSEIVAGSAAPGVSVQTVSLGGQAMDLSQLSPQMQDLVRMGLNMAERLKPMAESLGTTINVQPEPQPARQPPPEPMRAPEPLPAGDPVGPGGLEGRARIEGFRPFPDGTYEFDLYVTPRTKASYRVAMRAAVPHEHMDRLAKGLTLQARIDPEIASRVELIWD